MREWLPVLRVALNAAAIAIGLIVGSLVALTIALSFLAYLCINRFG